METKYAICRKRGFSDASTSIVLESHDTFAAAVAAAEEYAPYRLPVEIVKVELMGIVEPTPARFKVAE